MNLDYGHLKFPIYMNRTDRYFPFQADGQVNTSGYVQRPAAERQVAFSGRGLYDARTRTIIIQPDPAAAVENLARAAGHHEQEARKARATIDAILALHNESTPTERSQ